MLLVLLPVLARCGRVESGASKVAANARPGPVEEGPRPVRDLPRKEPVADRG